MTSYDTPYIKAVTLKWQQTPELSRKTAMKKWFKVQGQMDMLRPDDVAWTLELLYMLQC